jgi:hypothetical protein
MIDLVNHYKWTFFIILFQEPSRIEGKIGLKTKLNNEIAFFNFFNNGKPLLKKTLSDCQHPSIA